MDLGDGMTSNRSTSQLEMNKWYHIKLTRTGTEADLLINQKDKTIIKSPRKFTILNIGDKLYFGGLETSTTR
jgi:hypothetical protein